MRRPIDVRIGAEQPDEPVELGDVRREITRAGASDLLIDLGPAGDVARPAKRNVQRDPLDDRIADVRAEQHPLRAELQTVQCPYLGLAQPLNTTVTPSFWMSLVTFAPIQQ